MRLIYLSLLAALSGMVSGNTCSDRCSNNALCCCCETSHKIPGGSGWIQRSYTSQPRCMGQTCDHICKDWVVSSKNSCSRFNDPAGYHACASTGKPKSGATTNFRFYPNGNLAGGWSWESDTIKGVVINSNGVVAWQPDTHGEIDTICIAYNNNRGYYCYARPTYAACLLTPAQLDGIENAWGFA